MAKKQQSTRRNTNSSSTIGGSTSRRRRSSSDSIVHQVLTGLSPGMDEEKSGRPLLGTTAGLGRASDEAENVRGANITEPPNRSRLRELCGDDIYLFRALDRLRMTEKGRIHGEAYGMVPNNLKEAARWAGLDHVSGGMAYEFKTEPARDYPTDQIPLNELGGFWTELADQKLLEKLEAELPVDHIPAPEFEEKVRKIKTIKRLQLHLLRFERYIEAQDNQHAQLRAQLEKMHAYSSELSERLNNERKKRLESSRTDYYAAARVLAEGMKMLANSLVGSPESDPERG